MIDCINLSPTRFEAIDVIKHAKERVDPEETLLLIAGWLCSIDV
ncbi:MAG: hypothetical protein N2235_19085 [Fischerella sp.]|nr:hypothetical protein [Fischerella sp.]